MDSDTTKLLSLLITALVVGSGIVGTWAVTIYMVREHAAAIKRFENVITKLESRLGTIENDIKNLKSK